MRAIAAALLLAGSADAFQPKTFTGSKRSGFLGLFGKEQAPQQAQQAPKWGVQVPLRDAVSLDATLAPDDSAEATGSQKKDVIGEYCKAHGGDRPIRKILIANNGMAATKSIMSMRQWAYMQLGDEKAIEFVAMATPEDMKANAEFIKLADSFVEVPAGKNSNNYANVDVITKIAKDKGVDAVWPGWGHASENPKLPDTLNAMGIKFIGPNSQVMAALGDKIAANILAQTAGVPSIPWSGDGLTAELNAEGKIPQDIFDSAMVTNEEEALAAANRIGYPVMLKASEGGGGKGIRMSNNDEELKTNFVQVSNEVPGSPMFMMQLCQGARHLEVQIVGDEHGNAVAINGRDCSTQRRFQKIFEEGPPSIAKPATFREMEKAAQRLTQTIGYCGAGTVEYLYNAESDSFFFLELNPRLQVEHPVTEGISLVNMPATQLQVAMGIPLNRIPDIRRFYDKEDPEEGDSPIDFMEDDYRAIDTHVIAARITAENPDEGFKPTSGTIERVKFQSTTNVWGYFSVGANGGIHEFADSQFGHLFAKGPNREAARKSLVLALKEIEVRGEIRTTVDYLVQLLETKEFKENNIDTSWLDGIIREKSVSTELDAHTTVASAAIYRAFAHAKQERGLHLEALGKGQLSMGPSLASTSKWPLEITYKDVKYAFDVLRLAEDTFQFKINGGEFECKLREQPDGSLLATFGGMTRKIVGQEEPLGLRVVIDGTTCLLPNVFDPSELRTDVTGKVVRFLQGDGEQVEKGEAFVEVEAMKMIMPLKATESGAIKHELNSGAIISAGDMLASLTLKDPSKVKKILGFDADFDLVASSPPSPRSAAETLALAMAGYKHADLDTLVQQLVLEKDGDSEGLGEEVLALVDQFLAVEQVFAKDGANLDAINLELVKANQDDLGAVIDLNRAHAELRERSGLVISLLRAYEQVVAAQLSESPSRAALKERLGQLVNLAGRDYAAVQLYAGEIRDRDDVEPFETRKANLRASLLETEDLRELSKGESLSAGVELLTNLFADADVRDKALEAYIRRVYRAHTILDCKMEPSGAVSQGSWAFKYAGIPEDADSPIRKGHIAVMPSSVQECSKDSFGAVVDKFADEVKGMDKVAASSGVPLHNLFIAFGESSIGKGSASEKETIAAAEALVATQAAKLKEIGVRQVDVVVPQEGDEPRVFSLTSCNGFKEDLLRRDMRPTFVHLLELGRLQENFELARFKALGKLSQVYLGVERMVGRVKPQVLFYRGVSLDQGIMSEEGMVKQMEEALDQLDRSMLDSRVTVTTSSRIYVNLLQELDSDPQEAYKLHRKLIQEVQTRLSSRLLKLKVDEIEIKVRCKKGDAITSVRLVASSMNGKWLEPSAFVEYPDPVTGVTTQFCPINEQGINEQGICFLDPYPSSNKLQMKRAAVRRISSTYAYDFLGLMEVDLIQKWGQYLDGMKAANAAPVVERIPAGLFEAKELIFDEEGVLRDDIERVVGTNTVGMLAWRVFMKTPEYPEGREVVVIANDVTVQSGSFGVLEDDFFEAASQYARAERLPRVYIACNSGARIGLVETLKPLFKVAWKDEANPGQGFDYLYLSPEDYASLPEGTVEGKEVKAGGETRFQLSDIIGKIHGIGVENLRGSGTIAGETANAYNDVFTLSYVTGRSVGIGAYLVRLGQRTIQMQVGPLILTGYSALNKLLGREVYTSQDQLGGPQVMSPNGVSHLVVNDDQQGVAEIMKWLAYVPKTADDGPVALRGSDPVNRPVDFMPTKAPYDPRHMLAGHETPQGWVSGFFDKGSFTEYLPDWGKSVVVGRARLGGIPMGVISVETRLVEQRIPADPANPASREALQPQAGQVWYPDSAYKTAQAIQDFGRGENLPLIIFANWRGFSGGTRDMAGEILKFGAMIVDALVEYEHPVQVYIPPNGELRGGAWVVIDPTINSKVMEMYCDKESRGGILEPPGICEVKFRGEDQLKKMHQLDPVLVGLDADLAQAAGSDDIASLTKQIKDREAALLPLYLQVAHEFADLHDRSGRMKAKGVVRDVLEWKKSREYLYWRVKRRLAEQELVKDLGKAGVEHEAASAQVAKVLGEAYGSDQAFLAKMEQDGKAVKAEVATLKTQALTKSVAALLAGLSEEQKGEVLKSIK